MVAFFGDLGFELDPTTQYGHFFHLVAPDPALYTAWQVSSEDESLVGFYKLLA
jgi:hypothetical protein